ncbi:hypothetical protein ACFQH9_06520 [Pseudonocardia lutea]|uniref:DUF4282 domain-containing protein n=1 Tax=Pseudonocardia lutea TaxID=2172015 RepID=A0ABW1I6A6_9PSEU
MDYQTPIIVSYFFQIPLAVIALFVMPGRGTLSTPMENLRRNSAIIGLLPCAIFAPIFQAIALAIYYARIKALQRKSGNAWERIGGATSAPVGGANPFGGGTGGGQVGPPASGGNPFLSGQADPGSAGQPEGDAGPRTNPFL